MLTSEELTALSAAIPGDPDRARLLQTLQARAAAVLATPPFIPQVKALLSRDGGFCPTDGATLRFDPWSPDRHTCPRCGQTFSGDRHHRNWARAQHLWIAERAAELALIAALTDDQRAAARAAELIAAYHELYFALPNRDNVLGPSHLFFSTYLESLWITSYLAAAFILREAGLLPPDLVNGIDQVAEEAAALIGEFNEGLSNRQTWHSAALTAIAAWFGDQELATQAVESRTGLLGHLADGFGADGLWWEGENYHLFALRGLMQGMHWARVLGFDLLQDEAPRNHFRLALLGPSFSALPDFTYPARRDSRYGVSLAQPASLELWEIGRAWLEGDQQLDSWLGALYDIPLPLPPADHYDAWLHDAGRPSPEHRSRSDLSWWTLTAMQPAPGEVPECRPASVLLASQGLAVLRNGPIYASLECGREIGGHGHPDRLHLTVHANGVHWLPDPGTGSYVHPTLQWYRSALAHNAPRLDGANAGGADAWCQAFDSAQGWAWCRGRAGDVTRTIIAGPTHIVDILETESESPHALELPWHVQGDIQIESAGQWQPATLAHPFVSEVERFAPESPGPIVVTATAGKEEVRTFFAAEGAELLRATAPGLPTNPAPQPFLMFRATQKSARWVSVLDLAPRGAPEAIEEIQLDAELIELRTTQGPVRYRITPAGLKLEHGATSLTLAGFRSAPPKFNPVFVDRPIHDAAAFAPRIVEPPALDGTLDGFDLSAPLLLDGEHQYRRSEAPYDPEQFSALAWVNWDGDALYLAVAVSKPELSFRPPDAPPLLLDNEPEDINSDGIQVYLRHADSATALLVNPVDDGTLHLRPIGAEGSVPEATGSWSRTEDGYSVTIRCGADLVRHLGPGARLGFDLLINEMQADRVRRAGQLVWSGGNGWIYLRGDRQDASQLGVLELG